MTRVVSCFDKKSNQMEILIEGEFDDYVLPAFEKAYHPTTQEARPQLFILNLKQTTYLDSSIVASLFKLCDYARQCAADVFVMNMNDEVLSEFRVLNLHRLFKPEYHRETFRIEWVYHSTLK